MDTPTKPGDDNVDPVPGHDDEVARRMLDDLLGARPSDVLLREAEVCLATPRGLEVVDRHRLIHSARVATGQPLLGIAAAAGGVVLLTDDGELALWTPDSGMDRLAVGGPDGARCVAAGHGRLALAGDGWVQLLEGDTTVRLVDDELVAPARVTALAVAGPDSVLVATGNTLRRLVLRGGRLHESHRADLGEGDVIAVAGTRSEPGAAPVVVAFDEFGWCHVMETGDDGELHPRGALELELDGGVPVRAGLYCEGPQVMVASGTSFLHLLDLRPPPGIDEPVLMATVCAGMGLDDVVADEARVYLADAIHGLVVLDRALFQVCHDDPLLARVQLSDAAL